MSNTREVMVKKYGSEELYKAHMKDIRSKVKNIPGGSFKDKKFATLMSKRAVDARKKLKSAKEDRG